MCPLLNACYDVRKQDSDYAALRRLHEQWKAIAEYYLGDYYPLTSYSLENDVWMAWQFDRPDLGEGVVQVFRRAGSPYETASFKLHGLAPDARYTVRNSDAEGATDMTGRDLMEKGLPVALPNRPQAVVFTYAKAGGGAER
jgi:alpha-galactosidase